MLRRVCAWILVLCPTLAFAVDKEVLALQRDVAQLQDMVRQMQRSQDEKLAALQVLAQQSLTAANAADKSIAVIQSGLQQSLKDQEGKVVTPVVGLSTRMDSMANEFRTLQQAVADLTSVASKLQTQLTDLGNAVKLMQAPAAPPPALGAIDAPGRKSARSRARAGSRSPR